MRFLATGCNALFERLAPYLDTCQRLPVIQKLGLAPVSLRNMGTAILAGRRTLTPVKSGQIARCRRTLRRHFLNVTRGAAANSNSHGLHAGRSHFSSLRTRPPRRPLGTSAFNAPDLHIPEAAYFLDPDLNDPNNFACQHCGSRLWWEASKQDHSNSSAAAITRLRPVIDYIWRLVKFRSIKHLETQIQRPILLRSPRLRRLRK